MILGINGIGKGCHQEYGAACGLYQIDRFINETVD